MRPTCRYLAVLVLIAFLAACGHTPGGGEAALSAEDNLALAVIYESRSEIDLALKHFALAIELDKKNPEAYFALANLNLKIGNYREAEAAYKGAIRLKPGSGPYYNNLGWLYMETGRLAKAAATVATAIKRDPAFAHVYLDTLGVIQMKGAKLALAEKSFIDALELTPAEDVGSLRIIYGHMLDLYEKTGRGKEAEAIIEEIRRLR